MLTTAQQAVVLADINNSSDLSALPHNADGSFEIARLYSLDAVPDYWVWRTSVPLTDITDNGFAWDEVDGLSVGKARIWEWMFGNPNNSCNPSKSNVRQGIINVWSGTSAKLAVQAAVFGHCMRKANRLEKLLASGSGTTASPSLMTFEGTTNYQEIENIRTT